MIEAQSEYQKRLKLFGEHLAAAVRSAEMLKQFYDRIISRYPFKAEEVEKLPEEDQLLVFALFKKFEQLIVLLNDNIFKNIPYFDLENMSKMARYDAIIYAEKVGVVKSAKRFIDAVALRNQLAHEYPLNPVKQANLINNVIVEADVLLQAVPELRRYTESRLPVWSEVRKHPHH
jgi:hypothetical protein